MLYVLKIVVKKVLSLFLFLGSISCFYGQSIIVDQTTYTTEQLVTDILVGTPCANVSNITSSTGTDFGSVNGIGYFTEPTGNFPFSEGVLLTTGNAANAEGPETGTLSDGSGAWPGDADLEAAINTDLDGVPGDDLVAGESNNASIIQFDFVPSASSFDFNFIFASEEYGTFQCGFSDAFAFLLTDTSTGAVTNLAIVPNSNPPIEVSVFTVRDNTHNGACNSVNPNIFDSYYGPTTGLPPGDSPTNFLGYTRSLTASSAVTPGVTYNIKLVIADDGDTLFDAAVFLQAGSFSIGLDLGNDITISAGTAACDGDTVTLDTGAPTADHTWYLDGVEIMGETSSTLDVTVPGTYSVDVEFSAGCTAFDEIVIEFVDVPVANPAQDLSGCNGTNTFPFDLTENDDDVLGTQAAGDYTISYHESQADADTGANPLTSPYSNTSDPQTIFARIESTVNTDCFDTTSFELSIEGIGFTDPIDDLVLCDDDTDGFRDFTLTDQDLAIATSAGFAPADVTITYHISQADADADVSPLASPYTNTGSPETIFVRIEENATPLCFGTTTFGLIVNALPTINAVTDLEACDDDTDGLAEFTLTDKDAEVLGGQTDITVTYHETLAEAQSGANALASPYINTGNPQTVYIRLENTITGCVNTNTMDLVVNPLPVGVTPTPLEA